MSRFLLLFCFATLHVLGNQVSSTNNELQPAAPMPQQNQPVQHSEADAVSTKEVKSAEPVSVPVETDKTITKSEESSNNTQSLTDTPASSTTVPPNSKAVPTSTTVPASTIVSISTSVTTTTPNSTAKPAPTTTPKSTTKPAPITTSSPDIVSTTPSTPVVPAGTPGKWVVNGTTKICVVLQMAVSFNVSYDVNHTIFYKTFDMPIDNVTTTANGSCGSLEDQLTLTWSAKNINNGSMTLHFVQNATTKHYSLHHLEVILSPADFPNATFKQPIVLMHNESNFIVGVTNSYRCLKQQKLDLKRNDTKEAAGYLSVSGLQFQAFKADNSTVFGLAKDCAFDTPDVVPIAVGCTLTGLVIVVLISYLIARRRNQAHGYLSM